MPHQEDLFNELSFYTLGHSEPAYFIHQHVVDAYYAQTATADTKSITLLYALIGLYLFVEQGYTGRQVQIAHLQLSKRKIPGPVILLPENRGALTVVEIMEHPEGWLRDAAITRWCQNVWDAYALSHQLIRDYLKTSDFRPDLF